MTVHRSVSQVLSAGLETILDAWQREGTPDLFYHTLRIGLAEVAGQKARASREIPEPHRAEVLRRHRAINRYFDNIRYTALDPLTKVWGTIVNALRVAAEADSVTRAQRETFTFPVDSLVHFLSIARGNMAVCDELAEAFRPMPAPDCQMLAALFNANLLMPATRSTLFQLVRLLAAEGPLTAEENEAFAVLSQTGLVGAAFQGMRRLG